MRVARRSGARSASRYPRGVGYQSGVAALQGDSETDVSSAVVCATESVRLLGSLTLTPLTSIAGSPENCAADSAPMFAALSDIVTLTRAGRNRDPETGAL